MKGVTTCSPASIEAAALEVQRVHIDGGATCAEARQFLRFGPAFADLKRHPVAPMSDDPRIKGDWICEAERSAFRAPTLDIVCENDEKRVGWVEAKPLLRGGRG